MRRPNAVIFIILTFMTACFQSPAEAAEKIRGVVSILPQKYFVEKIGGSAVEISVMVAPHQNPENFEPLPSQMTALAKTDVYFAIGVPFEDMWLDKFASSFPDLRIVHTDDGIAKKPMDTQAGTHQPGPADQAHHSHHHGAMDPHVWLSPSLVMIQARHIRDALAAIDPARAPDYEANFNRFMTELELLDQKIKNIFATDGKKKEFMVFHPSWGYFADAYGLTQHAIEVEGKDPKAKEVKLLIDYAARHHIRSVFIQPQFSTKQAEIIAREMGARLEILDPLAEDWNENLLRAAAAIQASFEGH
ncbi:MAG: cation ABC transporter substrate-binding protein [Desulfobacteraceae bacterium]|nr:MAG: cation ABC transporter substrate-binding protein [Desulfobacteraceae bacterium]